MNIDLMFLDNIQPRNLKNIGKIIEDNISDGL